MKTEAIQNLEAAIKIRTALRAQGIDWNDPRIKNADLRVTLAQHELGKYERATMAEGFRWNR